MSKKLSLFIALFYVNSLVAQQLFLAKISHHWTNYYIVEIKGDTAIVENFEFYFIDNLHTQVIEKLVKIQSKDTLFSNGRTKIVSKKGKFWIHWGKYKRKLKDYTQKQDEITYIREHCALRLYKNNAIVRLNQTLGSMNYVSEDLDAVERTLSIETPRDSAIKAFQIVADSIIAKEKAKVAFFNSFINKEHLNDSEIIFFLNTANFTKQIEKNILEKIIINDIEKLSQVIENQDNKKIEKNLYTGVNLISENSGQTIGCRKSLQQSTCQSKTKRKIEKKMKVAKNKEVLRGVATITGTIALYELLIKYIFFNASIHFQP